MPVVYTTYEEGGLCPESSISWRDSSKILILFVNVSLVEDFICTKFAVKI